MSGKAFANKDQAIADFKAKNAASFTNKFDKEPSARPEYIPQTATFGGRQVNIIYNPTYRGYGYYDSYNRWTLYDTMADIAMMDMLMSHRGYYYGPPPVYSSTTYVEGNGNGGYDTVTVTRHGGGFFSFFFGFMGLIVVLVVVVIVVKSLR